MKAYFLVALGGGVGAVMRYQIGLWLLAAAQNARFPLGTLLVNVLGCFAVGLLWALCERLNAWSEEFRLALMIGLLGGFTTFSAFGLETVMMLRRDAFGVAAVYVLTSLILGGLAVWAGLALAGSRG
jgi:CrcB protein